MLLQHDSFTQLAQKIVNSKKKKKKMNWFTIMIIVKSINKFPKYKITESSITKQSEKQFTYITNI